MDNTVIYCDQDYDLTTQLEADAFTHAVNTMGIAYDLFWNYTINRALDKEDALEFAEKFEIFINEKHRELIASIKSE